MTERTVVMFTSDHGCHFKTRNAEYKRSCHESSIRVPTALQGPGFDGGGRISDLVNTIDLTPTLLDAAGIPVPEEMQGSSILPLTVGDNRGWPEETFVQISEAQVGRAVRTHRWKYGVNAPGRHGAQHAGSDRYIEQYLYDLEADPYELCNLIGMTSHAEVAEIMRQRLLRRMVEAGEEAPDVQTAEVRENGQRRVSPIEARS
jgi:arylsulfatase A-like enzyme